MFKIKVNKEALTSELYDTLSSVGFRKRRNHQADSSFQSHLHTDIQLYIFKTIVLLWDVSETLECLLHQYNSASSHSIPYVQSLFLLYKNFQCVGFISLYDLLVKQWRQFPMFPGKNECPSDSGHFSHCTEAGKYTRTSLPTKLLI